VDLQCQIEYVVYRGAQSEQVCLTNKQPPA
jgi:hypothetical protein